MKTITLVTFLFLSMTVMAQKELETTVQKIFSNIRSNTIEAIDTKIVFKKENARVAWALLIPFYSDTLSKIRDKAYNLSALLSINTSDDNMRKSVVNYLLIGCSDADPIVSKNCGTLLERFEKSDFNPKAFAALANLIQSNKANIGHTAQLASFVGVENLENQLLPLLEENIPNKEKWLIRLALARIGHFPSIAYVYEKVKSLPLSDDLIMEAFPALVYTRSKECFNYMITVVQSDKKECTSSNPDSEESILCGYRVLEYIVPYINDFPVKIQPSGDLQGDYNKALQTARNWFNDKGSNYSLNLKIY